jgi:hypothetical protein
MQRVGHGGRVEPRAFVAHADRHAGRRFAFERRELDVHALALVAGVAVLDGVDDRLANRHAHPMERFVVEAHQTSDVIADGLHEIHHLEGAAEIETDALAAVVHQACGEYA